MTGVPRAAAVAAIAVMASMAFASVASGRGTLLPRGFESTRGSQIVDRDSRPVRIAAVGWSGQNGLDQNTPVFDGEPIRTIPGNVRAMRDAGFNTVTVGWNDASLHDADRAAYLAGIDSVVAAARRFGLKVILNHHTDEGVPGHVDRRDCTAQQENGLWYDLGPGTDGTDGCGTAGTVTQRTFYEDWRLLARRYAGNATVIAFDLHNEPLSYPGPDRLAGMSTWGDGSATDLRRMYERLGSTLEAIDPGALIVCEGPQNYFGTFAGRRGVIAPEGDLTAVRRQPVHLTVRGRPVTDKVVYSVHEYPSEVSSVTADSGARAIGRYNVVWGYLVKRHIAPVWIGESGWIHDGDPDNRRWASTLTAYVNGRAGAAGGPTFTGREQGVGTTWFSWGHTSGNNTLNADGSLDPAPLAVYRRWRPH